MRVQAGIAAPRSTSGSTTDLLVVGAGPFGLAVAARAKTRGLAQRVVGKPLSFWREHMPAGMCLRSDYTWHLDPDLELSFARFLKVHGLEEVLPIPLATFQAYGDWFRSERGIEVSETRVTRLRRGTRSRFTAELESGETVHASSVLCAPGFRPFRHLPRELWEAVGEDDRSHSSDFNDPARFRGRRCLIVGGRQSAFESAALLAEHGAAAVTVVHRHPTPRFERSDWSWVAGDLAAAEREPGWFAARTPEQREAIERRFWAEGRLKLEPWLAPRLSRSGIAVIENAAVAGIAREGTRGYRAAFDGGASSLRFDHLILATGFRVDLARIGYLAELLAGIDAVDGSPVLTTGFESSIPGLFFTGLVAARTFGPYMGFTASCPFAGRTIVDAVMSTSRPGSS